MRTDSQGITLQRHPPPPISELEFVMRYLGPVVHFALPGLDSPRSGLVLLPPAAPFLLCGYIVYHVGSAGPFPSLACTILPPAPSSTCAVQRTLSPLPLFRYQRVIRLFPLFPFDAPRSSGVPSSPPNFPTFVGLSFDPQAA